MSLRSFEAEILRELRRLPGLSRLRQKDIMEWSTGPVKKVEGEVQFTLSNPAVNVVVKLPKKKEAPDA